MKAVEKYNARVEKTNSLVCVGLDSDMEKIPHRFRETEFPQFEFNKWIIGKTAEYAAAYKPNIAFYESQGEKGIAELKMTIEYLRERHPDIFAICDAKRADIGNTSAHYAKSIFDWFGFDAVTLNPYLGRDAIQPFLDYKNKGCIILCRTSSVGARDFQDLLVGGKTLWQIVAEKVIGEWNENENCMLVAGATYFKELKIIRKIAGDMTLLVPGVGEQGADLKAVVRAALNSQGRGLIINASRSIIFSENPGASVRALRDEINAFRT